MNSRKIYAGLHAAVLFTATLLLVACGGNAVKKDVASAKGGTSEIDKRAVERWDLLITGKPEKAYDFLSPGYKKTKTRDDYAAEMGNRPVHWSKVQFLGKDCDESVCHVRLLVDFTINVNIGSAHEASSVDVIKEDWLNLDGHWYYLPPALGATSPK
jgi:hypothetical protein